MPFRGDMLVPWRVISLSEWNPEILKFERLIFPTKYVIPKSLNFSHWTSKLVCFTFVGINASKSTLHLFSHGNQWIFIILIAPVHWQNGFFQIQKIIPGPSKGCQLNPKNGELIPFRNHLAPL